VTLHAGRILKGAAGRPVRVDPPEERPGRGARLERELARANAEAARLLAAAEQRGADILEAARLRGAEVELAAKARGRAEGLAELAALSLRLREEQARADEAGLDRLALLGRALAERLLGRVLDLAPEQILDLARLVLVEARGARRVQIHAHPADVPGLALGVRDFDPDGRVHAVLPDPLLGRGDLRLETELGSIDARLGPELERLATRLREALGP
jgi:flagellar biosynthesis/type III secretory pathway protein FliH